MTTQTDSKADLYISLAALVLSIISLFAGTNVSLYAVNVANQANDYSRISADSAQVANNLTRTALDLQNFNSTIDTYEAVAIFDMENQSRTTSDNTADMSSYLNVSAFVYTPHYGTVRIENLTFSPYKNYTSPDYLSDTQIAQRGEYLSLSDLKRSGLNNYMPFFDFNRLSQTSMRFAGELSDNPYEIGSPPIRPVGSGTSNLQFSIICELSFPVNQPSSPNNSSPPNVGYNFYAGRIDGYIKFFNAVTEQPVIANISAPVLVYNFSWG